MDKAAISAENHFFSVKSHIFYTKAALRRCWSQYLRQPYHWHRRYYRQDCQFHTGTVGCTGQHGAVGLGGSDAQQRTALAGG